MQENWQDTYAISYPFDPLDTDKVSIDMQDLLQEREVAEGDVSATSFTLTPNDSGESIESNGRNGFIAWAILSGLQSGIDYGLRLSIQTTSGLVLNRTIVVPCRQR